MDWQKMTVFPSESASLQAYPEHTALYCYGT